MNNDEIDDDEIDDDETNDDEIDEFEDIRQDFEGQTDKEKKAFFDAFYKCEHTKTGRVRSQEAIARCMAKKLYIDYSWIMQAIDYVAYNY